MFVLIVILQILLPILSNEVTANTITLKDTEISASSVYSKSGVTDIFYSNYRFRTDTEVKIAVLDTGITEDIVNRFDNRITINSNSIITTNTTATVTHANQMITIILEPSKYLGYCWLPNCAVIHKKVLSNDGYLLKNYEIIIALIQVCSDPTVDIINLSLSLKYPSISTEIALILCYMENKLVIASAGNDADKEHVSYPCSSSFTICVAGVNTDSIGNRMSKHSNYSSSVDIFAPSSNIMSLQGNHFIPNLGTSFSAAIVSGHLGLLKTQFPEYSNDELLKAIQNTAFWPSLWPFRNGWLNVSGSLKILAYGDLTDKKKGDIITLVD